MAPMVAASAVERSDFMLVFPLGSGCDSALPSSPRSVAADAQCHRFMQPVAGCRAEYSKLWATLPTSSRFHCQKYDE
jgi:hypothetical protein